MAKKYGVPVVPECLDTHFTPDRQATYERARYDAEWPPMREIPRFTRGIKSGVGFVDFSRPVETESVDRSHVLVLPYPFAMSHDAAPDI